MRPQSEQRDEQFDQNLRQIASQLQIPQRGPRRTAWTHRLWQRVTMVGSAAALVATIALVVMPSFQRVHASQILNAFRTTMLDGFKLQFDRLGTEEWQVSGELVMLLEGHHAEPAIDVFLDAELSTPADPQFGFETKLALTPLRQWAFLELRGDVRERFAFDPVLANMANVLREGVVLQLNGVWESMQAELTNGRLGRLLASSGLNTDPDSVIRALLVGQATHEQLEQLTALVEHAARDVRVHRIGGDLYALHVAELDPPTDMFRPSDLQLLRGLEIEIAYRSGVGIAWAEVRHVGTSDGLLRLEPTTRTASGYLFDIDHVVPSTATVIDVPSFVPRLVTYLV